MKFALKFVDDGARRATATLNLKDGLDETSTEFSDLIDAIDAVSDSSIESWVIEDDRQFEGAVAGDLDAPFSAKDKLLLSYITEDGANVRSELPAPKPAMFAPHDESADQGNVLVSDLLTAYQAVVTDEEAVPVNTLMGCRRSRRRRND